MKEKSNGPDGILATCLSKCKAFISCIDWNNSADGGRCSEILGIANSLTKHSQVHQLNPVGRAAILVGLEATPSRTGQLPVSIPDPESITHQSHERASG